MAVSRHLRDMARLLVLGAGLVGGWVADTLASGRSSRTAVDMSASLAARAPDVTAIQAPATHEMVDEHAPDVVVNALPGINWPRNPVQAALERGCAVADLAFTAEDPGMLHDLAVQHGGRLVWDIGVVGHVELLLQRVCDAMAA